MGCRTGSSGSLVMMLMVMVHIVSQCHCIAEEAAPIEQYTDSGETLVLPGLVKVPMEEALMKHAEDDGDLEESDGLDMKRSTQWNKLHGGWGKRAQQWNNLNGMWGKRAQQWNNLNGMWGKRAQQWNNLNGMWGKRSPSSPKQLQWNNLNGMWGKRGWNDMNGGWGKRAAPHWNNLRGMWGKRSV